MAIIDYSVEEWKQISDGIDKLLDLEARQPRKTINYKEFGMLEHLLIRIARITGEKPRGKLTLAEELAMIRSQKPQMTKRR